jgi:photosystem II stability/assembly factor-like uncharacterized protein
MMRDTAISFHHRRPDQNPFARGATIDRRTLLGLLGSTLSLGLPSWASSAAAPAWLRQETEPYTGKQDDIFFVTPEIGWYGNGKGKLYATRTGGEKWELVWEKPGTFVRALGFIDENVGFLGNVGTDYFPPVTDPCPVYLTRDGGRSWDPISHIDGLTPKGICAIDVYREPFIDHGDLGYKPIVRAAGRVGGPAFVIESHDAGASWRSHDLSSVTGMILDIKFVSAKVGFLAGASDPEIPKSNALVLRTDDGGETWRRVYRSARPWEITWKIAFPTENVGYATVQNYNEDPKIAQRVVAKTEDGGRTWRELPLTKDHAYQEFGVSFLDIRRGWVGGSSGGFETRDGGRHWHAVDMGTKVNKVRILRMPQNRIRVFAIGQGVYRLDDAG